jgi:hypothetical protein
MFLEYEKQGVITRARFPAQLRRYATLSSHPKSVPGLSTTPNSQSATRLKLTSALLKVPYAAQDE